MAYIPVEGHSNTKTARPAGRRKTRNVFVFDYDDTLAWTQCYYTRSKARLTSYIIDKFFPECPDALEITAEFKKNDGANVKKYGLSTKRFPTSWLETYEHFCKEYGHTPSKWEEYRIKRMANSSFNIRKGLVNGAEETLGYIASGGDRLILLTKGDPALQKKKLEKNHLERWFGKKDTHVVEIEKADAFKEIMEECEREYGKDGFNAYSVGNSYKSDIQPAIDAGMKGILIPFDTWALDKGQADEEEQKRKDVEDRKLLVLDSLTALQKHYVFRSLP